MKRLIFSIFILGIILINFSCTDKGPYECTIEGTVIDRPESDSLVFLKLTEDLRMSDIGIPIIDGKFTYTFTTDHIETYQLVFLDEALNGAWRPINFLPINGTITMMLYTTDEFNKNTIIGSKYHDELSRLKDEEILEFKEQYEPHYKGLNLLFTDKKYFNEEYYALMELEQKTKDWDSILLIREKSKQLMKNDGDKSKEYLAINEEILKIQKVHYDWRYNNFKENIDIVNYNILIEDLLSINQKPAFVGEHLKEVGPLYIAKFPSHPYSERLTNFIRKLNNLVVGGNYIDFSAPDLKNNEIVDFKDVLLENKITLLDLWASWCGPCIGKSKSVIPIYEEYKDKGFNVLAVARENENTDAMIKSIERNKFPWQQLVELNDENAIWEKYGIANSGGSVFLIDKLGKVLAIDPTVDEIREILESQL